MARYQALVLLRSIYGVGCTGVAPTVAGRVAGMSDPINLLATFIPNEGEFFRVKLALEIAIDEVVNEPGCLRYELTEATEEKLVLTEQWASEEDLAAHGKGSALQDLGESLSALLAHPPKVERV